LFFTLSGFLKTLSCQYSRSSTYFVKFLAINGCGGKRMSPGLKEPFGLLDILKQPGVELNAAVGFITVSRLNEEWAELAKIILRQGDFFVEPRVQLIRWTENADSLAQEAAAICYDAAPSPQVLQFCIKSGHHSILEHNAFTFKIWVARIISQQFTRHRIASFSQRSQRYCVEDAFAYYTPPEIAGNPEATLKWESFQTSVQELYDFLVQLGIPAESARMALTNATQTVFLMTMNARELRHFFKLRLCRRAQREIRQLAWQMLAALKQVSPVLFGDIDYPCKMAGFCDQGRMGCGITPSLDSILQAYYSLNFRP
jgi:thymidylate synthase (FAD)